MASTAWAIKMLLLQNNKNFPKRRYSSMLSHAPSLDLKTITPAVKMFPRVSGSSQHLDDFQATVGPPGLSFLLTDTQDKSP
jgi:hypothetical protein